MTPTGTSTLLLNVVMWVNASIAVERAFDACKKTNHANCNHREDARLDELRALAFEAMGYVKKPMKKGLRK